MSEEDTKHLFSLRSELHALHDIRGGFTWPSCNADELLLENGKTLPPALADLDPVGLDYEPKERWRKSRCCEIWRCTVLDAPDSRFRTLKYVVKVNIAPRDKASREIHALRALRHIHVCAYVASFQTTLWTGILLYPAACCDLHDLLQWTSDELGKPEDGASEASVYTHSADRTETDRYYRARILHSPANDRRRLLLTYPACLCSALAYIHAKGILHRDIKPENALIDWNGAISICDFGAAISIAEYTVSDGQKGSARYAAPEAFRHDSLYTKASDVFSLAAVLSEIETLLCSQTLSDYQSYRLRNLQSSPRRVERRFSDTIEECQTWTAELGASTNEDRRGHIIEALSFSRAERPSAGQMSLICRACVGVECKDCQMS